METVCERSLALSDMQVKVLRQLDRFLTESAYSPTLEDLAEPLGVSKQRVHTALIGLQLKGAIERQGGPRSRKLTNAGRAALKASAVTQ